MGEHGMTKFHKINLLKGVKTYKLDFCKCCVLEKHCMVQFKPAAHKIERNFDYIHTDLWGPTSIASRGRHKYFMSLLMTTCKRTKYKSEMFTKFKLWNLKQRTRRGWGRGLNALRQTLVLSTQIQNFRSFVSSMGLRDISRFVRHHNKMAQQKG